MTTALQRELAELLDANRRDPNVEIERSLLQVRAALFAQRHSMPVAVPPLPAMVVRRIGLPVVSADRLDVASVRESIAAYGALHVRGLIDPRRVDRMRDVIDRALAAQEEAYSSPSPGPRPPWFVASDLVTDGEISRQWVRGNGAVLAVDSPHGMFQVLEMFYELGIDQLVTAFFAERPALSAEKTALRRATPEAEAGGWHQDGQFLGSGIRSLNVWLALSDCGVDAPGLELVPTRLDHIVQPGTEGAPLDWCVSPSEVEKNFPGIAVRPEFEAGDALLFDHFLLHRTWRHALMTRPRYAIESWFFAPSAYPASGQTGLYV